MRLFHADTFTFTEEGFVINPMDLTYRHFLFNPFWHRAYQQRTHHENIIEKTQMQDLRLEGFTLGFACRDLAGEI